MVIWHSLNVPFFNGFSHSDCLISPSLPNSAMQCTVTTSTASIAQPQGPLIHSWRLTTQGNGHCTAQCTLHCSTVYISHFTALHSANFTTLHSAHLTSLNYTVHTSLQHSAHWTLHHWNTRIHSEQQCTVYWTAKCTKYQIYTAMHWTSSYWKTCQLFMFTSDCYCLAIWLLLSIHTALISPASQLLLWIINTLQHQICREPGQQQS